MIKVIGLIVIFTLIVVNGFAVAQPKTENSKVHLRILIENSEDHSFYINEKKLPDNERDYTVILESLKEYTFTIYSVRSYQPYKVRKIKVKYTPLGIRCTQILIFDCKFGGHHVKTIKMLKEIN